MPNIKKPLLEGTKFNDLTIISFHHKDKRSRWHYLCRCVCGKEKTVQESLLKSGNMKSCGCLGTKLRAKRLPNSRGVINHLILQYRRHAKDRGIEYALTYETFAALLQGNCYYCGGVPSNIKITKNCREGYVYSGIDRLDSSRGYVDGNVASCCGMCNLAKSNHSVAKFGEWAIRLGAMAEQWSNL